MFPWDFEGCCVRTVKGGAEAFLSPLDVEYMRSEKNNTYSTPFSAENGIRGNTYVFYRCLPYCR